MKERKREREKERRKKIKSVKFTLPIKRKINAASRAHAFTRSNHLQESGPSRAFVKTGKDYLFMVSRDKEGRDACAVYIRLMLPSIVKVKERVTADEFVFYVGRLFMKVYERDSPYTDLYRERRGRLEFITRYRYASWFGCLCLLSNKVKNASSFTRWRYNDVEIRKT